MVDVWNQFPQFNLKDKTNLQNDGNVSNTITSPRKNDLGSKHCYRWIRRVIEDPGKRIKENRRGDSISMHLEYVKDSFFPFFFEVNANGMWCLMQT